MSPGAGSVGALDARVAPRGELRSLPVPARDPLALFAAAGAFGLGRAFFFRDDTHAVLAFGAVETVETEGTERFRRADEALRRVLERRPALRGLRWFGGFAFEDGPPRGAFAGFGALRFSLPRVLWRRERGRSKASLQVLLESARDEALWTRALEWAHDPSPSPGPLERARITPPLDDAARDAWERAVRSAHHAFATGAAQKIVLSRDLRLRGEEPFEAAHVLASLEPRSSSESAFAVEAGGSVFLGLSPERLVAFDGARVRSEALAGSSGAEDPDGLRLLASEKDRGEHQHVVDHIVERLAPFVSRVEAPEVPELRRLGHLAHLVTPIEGTPRGPASLLELAGALHPTPAVGGVPLEVARRVIGEAEGRDRGWYAGAVGWIAPDAKGSGTGDLRVALRSALLEGREARAFVGAGLVPESTAEGEWRETALKAQRLLAALGGG